MTSVRTRTCAAGAAVAVVAGALVDHGAWFGSDFVRSALLGVLLGAVIGLVPHRTPVQRLAGFAAGFGAAWLGYLLRAGILPDIPMGRAIAAVLVVSLVTAVATATADRLPLWSGLLGAGALVGAYEATYAATPSEVVGDSTAAATSVLLAAAFGFAVTAVLSATAGRPVPAADPAAEDEQVHDEPDVGLDIAHHSAPQSSTSPAPAPRVASDVQTPSETSR